MRVFFYHLLALPIYLVMLLPMPVLYVLSDVIFVLLYHVTGYRKKVVGTNLRNAFPEKSEEERNRIAKAYYRFMVDVFIETFALLTMSPAQLKKRMVFSNPEVIAPLVEKKQSFLFVLGHCGNWEWCGQSFQLQGLVPLASLYHPISNGFFDWLTLRLRSRWNMRLIPMQNTVREMVALRNQFTATAFIADQTPSSSETAYWTTFLNQDTPVFAGTEKIAKKFNYPVVFASITRTSRGYYRALFTLVTESPASTPEGWITEEHTKLLEKAIRAQPETWLWSHRRWKHKRNVE